MSSDRVAVARKQVLIVDDNPQVRRELRTLLPLAGDIEIVGEAADGQDAVRLAEALRPDVILMDLEMPVLDGCEATRQIKATLPSCRVIALTVHGSEGDRREAGRSGADAFLVKGTGVERLIGAILGAAPDPDGGAIPDISVREERRTR